MKNLFVILTIFSLAFLFGCQENQIIQPETDPILKDNLPYKNTVKICCEVHDPNFGVCNLNGCVNYTHKVINESMGPMKRTMVSVGLYMNSVLCDKLGIVHLEWRVEGRSNEVVYVSEEGILLLEKTYPITYRNDSVILVQYLVTTDGVGVSKVSIVPIENVSSVSINNQVEY